MNWARRDAPSHSITSNVSAQCSLFLSLSLHVYVTVSSSTMARRGESPRMYFARIILCKYWLIFTFSRRAAKHFRSILANEVRGKGRGRSEQTDGKRDPREMQWRACTARNILRRKYAREYNGIARISMWRDYNAKIKSEYTDHL